jgi:F0F1-type ATP synthase membrane subunit b/b'
MDKLIFPAIHLALLIGIIVYMVKTPFGEFLRGRHKEISDGLNRTKIQALEAETKKKEVEAKLLNLDLEKQKISAEWKEREAAQIKALHDSSQRIIAQMRVESEQNKKALELFYRSEAMKSVANLVIAQAEQKIRQGLNPETHRKINERFASEVISAQSTTKALEA